MSNTQFARRAAKTAASARRTTESRGRDSPTVRGGGLAGGAREGVRGVDDGDPRDRPSHDVAARGVTKGGSDMADGINQVFVAGNVTRDPELKGSGESQVLRIGIAVNESFFDRRANERKERVEYVNVVVFGGRASALASIITKGMPVTIHGSLRTSSWEKDGVKQHRTEVVATNVVLGSRREGGTPASRSAPRAAAPKSAGGGFGGGFGGDDIDESEIPF